MSVQSDDIRSAGEGASAEPFPAFEPPAFEEELSRRLWDNYVERIEAMLDPLQPDTRREIEQELKVHLLESIRHDEAEQESERVLNATEKLGRPEEYLEPIVTDRLIEEGSTTYNPLRIMKGLGRTITQGVKMTVLGFLFVFGYLTGLAVASLAVLKPFFPENVGLFYSPNQGPWRFAFGFIDQPGGMREVLGYWVIPVSIVLSALMYVGLTKLLVLLRQSE